MVPEEESSAGKSWDNPRIEYLEPDKAEKSDRRLSEYSKREHRRMTRV